MRYLGILLLALSALVACSDSPVTEPNIQFLSLSKVSGDVQTALPGAELPDPIVVQVTAGKRHRPVEGVAVNFVPVEGGGSVSAGTAVTDAGGYASDRWTLGPESGTNRLEVRTVDGQSGKGESLGEFTAAGVFPNRAPSVYLAVLAEAWGYPLCKASDASDPDGDWLIFTYQWLMNGDGFWEDTPPWGPSEYPKLFLPGDEVQCRVRAFDGELYSPWTTWYSMSAG